MSVQILFLMLMLMLMLIASDGSARGRAELPLLLPTSPGLQDKQKLLTSNWGENNLLAQIYQEAQQQPFNQYYCTQRNAATVFINLLN